MCRGNRCVHLWSIPSKRAVAVLRRLKWLYLQQHILKNGVPVVLFFSFFFAQGRKKSFSPSTSVLFLSHGSVNCNVDVCFCWCHVEIVNVEGSCVWKSCICGICCYIFAGQATLCKSGTLKSIKKWMLFAWQDISLKIYYLVILSTLFLCYAE